MLLLNGPVLLCCVLQAVSFELVQVDLSDKPSWYRAVNPQGLVPAVVHQGEARAESLDLCRYGQAAQPSIVDTDSWLANQAAALIDDPWRSSICMCAAVRCRWIDGTFNTDASLTPAAPGARRQMEAILNSSSRIVSAGKSHRKHHPCHDHAISAMPLGSLK
jgi:hypothetical protein